MCAGERLVGRRPGDLIGEVSHRAACTLARQERAGAWGKAGCAARESMPRTPLSHRPMAVMTRTSS